MSVYINGMEMPKNEPMLVKINPDGSVSTTAKNSYRKYEAIAVPDHGDLIDRDVLGTFRELITREIPGGKLTREYVAMAAVRNVKTIIPADKERGE